MYFRSYMYITELILVLRNLYWSYGTYTGISDLIHVITELIHVFQILHVYYGTYIYLTELILVLRILYVYYRTDYCISDIEVPVGTTEHFNGTKVPVDTTEQIPYTEVLVGTTGLILILRIREYS